MTMIEQRLTPYSAERYYLISEIDQKSATFFVCDHGDERPGLDGEVVLTVLYALWDHSRDETMDEVLKKITSTHAQLQKLKLLSANILIAIDMLVLDEVSFFTHRDMIQSVLDQVSPLSSNTSLIAVSDKAGSLPALQRCQELIEAAHPGMYEYPINLVFAGYSQVDMLGHDPRIEPVGNNAVFQMACWSRDGLEAELLGRVRAIDRVPDVVKALRDQSAVPSGWAPYSLLAGCMALAAAFVLRQYV